jgi:hypothetical protein
MISGELIQIDGESVPSLKSYEVGYEKVWKDRTTNMAGDVRATILGINIVLSVEFGGVLLQSDITSLLPKLKQDFFSVTFYDPETDTTKTADYFCDGYDVALLDRNKGRFDTIPVTFSPISRSA